MQQPAQLKTLADLMAQAAHYAEYCLRKSGSLSPTLFLLGEQGPVMLVPQTMADESDKDAFANLARLVCVAHAATCCVMALEAWMKAAKDGEPLTEPPSQALDRQEVVVLMGEDRTGQLQKILPIVRHDNGKFFNLADSAATGDQMQGRFAQILSSKVPDKATQELAKAMLSVNRTKVVRLGLQSRHRR